MKRQHVSTALCGTPKDSALPSNPRRNLRIIGTNILTLTLRPTRRELGDHNHICALASLLGVRGNGRALASRARDDKAAHKAGEERRDVLAFAEGKRKSSAIDVFTNTTGTSGQGRFRALLK